MHHPPPVVALLLCLSWAIAFPSLVAAVTPLTVQDAVNIALTHHPRLLARQASIIAARQRKYQREAEYLPRGAYTYTLNRRQQSVTAAVGGTQIDDG
ncbi:MAG: hypothetical protein AB7G75_19050 [Candidatus Binatia bacterium]